MRRFFILSVFLPFIINVCVLSAADRLFIAGDAVSDGLVQSLAADVQGDGSVSWHGELAPVMHPEGDDVFTFTGWFAADKEFKFIQDRNWGGGYYNAAGITGYLDLEEGGSLTTDPTGDAKFKLAAEGWYQITCDLQALTIRAEKQESGAGQTFLYQALYMVGDATLTDWDLSKSLRMEYVDGATYSGEFYLKAGHFKLATTPYKGFDNSCFFFRDAENATLLSRDATGDLQWEVKVPGLYTVTVDLDANTIAMDEVDFGQLYVVGDAVYSGWSANDAPMMDKEGSVYRYTGWFDADKEFKFTTRRDLELTTLQLHNGAGVTARVENGLATLMPNVSSVSDYKFMLAEASNYTIVCDLENMTLTVEKATYQEVPIRYSALYMVGTATPDNEQAETFPEKAVKLFSNGDNTYSAQGVELVEGVFKLLTANDRGWNTTNLYRNAEDASKVSEDGTDDRKWTVDEAGRYDIMVDLSAMTISYVKQPSGPGTGTVQVEANGVRVLQAGRAIEVLLPDGVTACFDLYDLSGKHVAGLAGMSGCAVLGGELTPGIYALRVAVGGRVQVQKILVR